MDQAALDTLAAERIDWRFKGFPARFDGITVRELAAAKPALAQFGTPLLVLDGPALDHNLRLMARYCAEHGVDLAPHGKTTMAPQLFARQLAAGCWGLTAATIAHVRAYRAFGVDTIVLANQLLDADSLRWAAAELGRAPRFRLLCFADSVAGVGLMQAALAEADARRPLDVIIDLGAPGGRTGCRDVEQAVEVARAIGTADRLRLVGAGGFEGALAPDRASGSLEHIRAYLRALRQLVEQLDEGGWFYKGARFGEGGGIGEGTSLGQGTGSGGGTEFGEAKEIIVTAGGSAYFDDVVGILGGAWKTSRPVRTVLRSGAYIAHDDGHYRRLTPFGPSEGFRPALSIRGRVLSTPEPGLALLDFGKRDAPLDLGLPEPHTIERADGTVEQLGRCSITALADQHAFLRYDEQTRLSVGEIVSCGISHPCTAFDKWQLIPLVEDGRVVDVVRTFF